MADNLESYFKKHLSDDTPGGDNWNVPSDEVWQKVSPLLGKKAGIFIPRKYLYMLGGLLLTALLLVFLWPAPVGKNKPTGETVSVGTGTTKTITNESPAAPEPVLESGTSDVQPVEKSRQENIRASETGTPLSKNTEMADEVYTRSNKKSLSQLNTQSGIGSNKRETTAYFASAGNEKIQIALLFPRQTDVTLQPDVVAPAFEKPLASMMPEEPLTEKTKKEPFDNKGKSGLGAFFAPTFTSTYVSGDPGAGKMKAGNMFLYSSNWGFEFRYFISNRFTFVTGIEKTEIKSWSKSLVDFSYDPSGEHIMPGGEKENTSVVPMPTPFGEITTEITYRFPGDQQIPDGEIMQSVLETHQEVRYLSIPVGVEFNIIRFSRFGWFAGAGLQYNRALRDATNFTSQILHQEDEMEVVDQKMVTHPDYTRNYLGFYAGTGMNYQFSKFFMATASFRYSGNLTHVNLQDNLSTYVQGINFRIGIVYLFGASK